MSSNGAVEVAWTSTNPANLRTATSVHDLRNRSGLTWDEFAKLFGVSRRAVHSWASGGRMNSANASRLQALAEVIARVHGSSDAIRATLLAPDESGTSIYQQLVASRWRPSAPPTHLAARLGADVEGDEPQALGRIVGFQALDE